MVVIIFRGEPEDLCLICRVVEKLDAPVNTIVSANAVEDIMPLLQNGGKQGLFVVPDFNHTSDLLETLDKNGVSCPLLYKNFERRVTYHGRYILSGKAKNKPEAPDFFDAFKEQVNEFVKDERNGNKPAADYPATENSPGRRRFLVKASDKLRAVETKDIAYFFTENRLVYIRTADNRKIIIDYSVEELARILSTEDFFRVSRSAIVSFRSIKEVILHFSNRLLLVLEPAHEEALFVSRDRITAFKKWMGD